MGPFKHLACGLALGMCTYAVTKKRDAAIACLVGAVIPDTDHLIEYVKYCRDYDRKPSFEEWASGEYFNEKGTVYVIFHSWEACILLWCISKGKNVLGGLVLGYTSHLLLDQIGNNLNRYAYFELYRLFHEFKQDNLIEIKDDGKEKN